MELQYRTFDELMEAVKGDFKKYDLEGMIGTHELIKVAQKINSRLTNKILQTGEAILEVDKGRVRLPLNFHKENFAMMCGEFEITTPIPTGIQTEDKILDACEIPVADPCTVRLTECGDSYQVIQTFKSQTRCFKQFGKVTFIDSRSPECSDPCVGQVIHPKAWIKGKFLHTNFTCGKVYLNYDATMEDEDGNLLVLDHPIINDYYEYALKDRILENLIISGEPVGDQYKLIADKLRKARIEAEAVNGMPEFTEIMQLRAMNRRAMYKKYFSMFENHPYYVR